MFCYISIIIILKYCNLSLKTNSRARFHVTVITQINKSVVYFTVWRNVKFGVLNANPCIKFDMKSGLGPVVQLASHTFCSLFDENFIYGLKT